MERLAVRGPESGVSGPGSTADIVHELRNAATSVSLAIHSLSESQEIKSNAGRVRLQIARKELEHMRQLLDRLASLEPRR
nr:MAG: hypothetical protein DIU72_10365 [Pseudomonadota bacterium]